MNPYTIIAIDIAKDSLQVLIDDKNINIKFNDEELNSLHERIKNLTNPLVVCEATGGYERKLVDFCHNNAISVCLVNPAMVRAFARSEGVRAKSDPIDTKILLRFAVEKELEPSAPVHPDNRQIADLLDRRNQLSSELNREKNRKGKYDETMPQLSDLVEESIFFIEKQIEEIDAIIEDLIKNSERLKEAYNVMTSICGIGKVTAWTITAYLSEITETNRNQIVALAGIAPYNRDSGKTKGKRSIQAGRAKVRKCLYMATQAATQHNMVIKSYYQGLKARGKPGKCAMVAAMRKMLLHIQSELKKHEISLA